MSDSTTDDTPPSPTDAPDPGATATPASTGRRDRPASHLGVVTGEDGITRPAWASTGARMREYYDTEWGIPVLGERDMFELLSLETFQAGMSWEIVLRKRDALRELFAGFDPEIVADFGPGDIDRLLEDSRGIRNRRKIEAVVTNAAATVRMRAEGGLAAFVWSFIPPVPLPPHPPERPPAECPESVLLARALRRRGFRYVGPRNMFALMEAAGIIDTRLANPGTVRRETADQAEPEHDPTAAGALIDATRPAPDPRSASETGSGPAKATTDVSA